MARDWRIGIATGAGAALAAGLAIAGSQVETSAGLMEITMIAKGFDEPWAIAFLPDGSFLVTERGGQLIRVAAGESNRIEGLPEVAQDGQGGLLDVMIPADFSTTREVWLSYSAPLSGGSATAVGAGRLSSDGTAIEGFTPFWVGDPVEGGRHFGSRLVEAADGSVFFTTGDRGTGPEGLEAQDPARAEGKVIHLNRDGTPATAKPGWRPGVYSIGHRNAQGLALDRAGALWLVEHGARGGDELNLVQSGLNYGWPVISYGINYDGDSIGDGQKKEGMEQPVHYWDPSIAPSGLAVLSGRGIPDWAGDVFTGSLNADFLSRLDPDKGYAEERIASPETGRVRDVVEAPDGSIWFLSVYDGAVYRLAPVD